MSGGGITYPVCIIDGCTKRRNTAGHCTSHWYRLQKYGSVTGGRPVGTAVRKKQISGCSVPGCPRPYSAKGYCTAHYNRMSQGRPICDTPVVTKGIVDRVLRKSGYVFVYVPAGTPGSYKPTTSNSKRWTIEEHRHVMQQMLGRPLLPDESVHHKNGLRSDNRGENLELWVRSQPYGARATDLVEWAREILRRYDNASSEQERASLRIINGGKR